MKRILSLGLAAVLALGSVPMTFAAEATSGEMLKEAGFVAGDASGNLNEDQKITREQMMVLIAEMNGVKEEAATFGIPADFTDVSEDDWFAPYVWYAFYQGWTTGMGDGTFGAGKAVDSRMAATFMLKALGYEVADYNASVEQAKEVGIEVSNTTELTRGEAFDAMWDTVNLPKEGSDVALGVELGRLEAQTPVVSDLDAEIDEAYAVGTKVIDVTFENDVDADEAEAADFSIVKKGTSETVDIERVQAVASDRVYIFTEELKAGDAYTVVLGDQAYNFSAIYKESDKPEIESVVGEDTGMIEVEFDTNVDWDSATDIANYSIDKEGTVVSAKVKDDYKTVELYTEGITKRQSLKLTVENVMNADGVKMDKDVNSFYPVEDDDAPTIEAVNPEKLKNNFEVEIFFDDDHGVDKATAEDVSNYAIEGVEILSAEVDDVYWDDDADEEKDTDNDYYNKVTLTTSKMDAGDKYELKVLYMMDGSLSKNATTKTLEKTFRAGSEDDDEPKLTSAEALSETVVKIVFDDDNDLDPVTALDTSNYDFEDDELSVYNVWFKDDDEEEKTLYMETSKMDTDQKYTLIVNNIADIVGNTMDEDDEDSFDLDDVNYNGSSAVKKVEVVDLETLKVTFSDPIKGADAEDPTNYEIEGVGKAVDAEWDEDDDGNELDNVVILTVDELDNNETYTLVVDGVENFAERTMDDYEFEFVATSDENDDELPEVDNVTEEQEGVVLVEFSEDMTIGTTVPDVMINMAAYDTWSELTTAFSDVAYLDAKVTETSDATKFPKGTGYKMVATAQTDDDETVVFNGFTVYNPSGAIVSTQGEDVTFDIGEFHNVWDDALNSVDYDEYDEEVAIEPDFVADNTVDVENTESNQRVFNDKDSVEVDSADQEDADEVHVYFDEKIQILSFDEYKLINPSTTKTELTTSLYKDDDEDGKLASSELTSNKYTVSFDDDDDESLLVLNLENKDYFSEDEEVLIVDLNTFVTDLIGRPVTMDTTSFDTNNEDDDEPKIDDIRAINQRQIEIEWSVNLSDEGSYKIINKEDDDWNKDGSLNKFDDVDIDDNVVTITLKDVSDLLDADETYELVIVSNVESVYGENSDMKGDDFDFAGSSTPFVGNTFSGVSYLNGTKVKLIDDDDFISGDKLVKIEDSGNKSGFSTERSADKTKVYDSTTYSYVTAFPTNDDSFELAVAEYTPFLEGVIYDVTVKAGPERRLGDDDLVAGSFTGTVELLNDFETKLTSASAVELAIDNLESDEDLDYTLYLFGSTADITKQTDATKVSVDLTPGTEVDQVQVAGADTSDDETDDVYANVTKIKIAEERLYYTNAAGTYNYAILVVKDGENVRYVTDVITLSNFYVAQ